MPGKVARNTVLAVFWQAIRVVVQAAWVIVLARALHVAEYGVFAGLAALAGSLSGLSGLGSGMVMLRHASSTPTAFTYLWRQGIQITLISGTLLACIFILILRCIAATHGTGYLIIVAIGVSELFCTPLVTFCSQAFQAHERLGWSVALPTLSALVRLLVTIIFVLDSSVSDLDGYACYHVGSALISATVAVLASFWILRPPRHRFHWRRTEAREGITFSALFFTSSATTDFDKPLVLHFGDAGVAGSYSIGSRFVNVIALPVVSMIMAVQPRLFRAAGKNTKLVRHAIMAIAGYSLIAILLMQALASMLPILLGEDYAPAIPVARMLVLIVPLYGMRLLATSQLTALGKLGIRVLVEAVGVVALIASMAWLVPAFAMSGAVSATLASELLLALLAWVALWICTFQRG